MKNSSSGSSITDSVKDMFIPSQNMDVLNNTKIGKGTYGFVEKGKLKNENGEWIPVAIKYMHDRHDVQHLVTEARAMWRLKGHPHCVQVYGLFDCPGPHGVGAVMEYMDCKSLADLIVKQEIVYEMDHFVSWMWQLASAVDYFHSNNALHRDLKLQNLLLSERYRILKVGDFGTYTPQRDSMKSMRGTPVTMAPEIFKSEKYNKKCDIYSVGIIMWQLIARREPYEIHDASALLWNVAAAGKRPPEVTCHKFLSDFYKRCWHEIPAARPDSSEVLQYFTILKKVYPNGDTPLIDTATREPARTPQPQNVILSPSLRGHRRTGSDQSTLTFKTVDSGLSDPREEELRTRRPHSANEQNRLPSTSGSGTLTQPGTFRAPGNILEFIDQNLRPPPPLPDHQESNTIYNEHVAQCQHLYELCETLRKELANKHAMQLRLKTLLEAKSKEEDMEKLVSIRDDALKKIQQHS